MTTTIPCTRPKVLVEPNPREPSTSVARCYVPGCGWTYPGDPSTRRAVKSDATEQAIYHRRQHRSAVPESAILLRRGGGYQAECDCSWVAAEGVLTKADNAASLANHLSREHGLVTC